MLASSPLAGQGDDNTPAARCDAGLAVLRQDIDDWRVRDRAQTLIRPAVDEAPYDPHCLLAFGELLMAQNSPVDANRMFRRAADALRRSPDAASRTLLADLLFRWALQLDDWIRNFDYLVRVDLARLGVSTPECVITGAFCLNFRRPREFNGYLENAPSLSAVAEGSRRALDRLLDSILVLKPTHEPALRMALRRALYAEDWAVLAAASDAAIAAGMESPFPRFGRWLAASHRAAGPGLDRAFADHLTSLTPDSVAAYEQSLIGLDAERAGAVWRLSDPLYLTDVNERRIQFHQRLAMAEIAFADPERHLPGRETQPGQLILRYGWPRRIWEVAQESGVEVDPDALALLLEYVGCNLDPAKCAGLESRMPHSGGSRAGRWTFFNYALAMPSFIFERGLSMRTYRYKVMTQTLNMDSALARNVPSTFESPYDSLASSVLITRFPRPGLPVVEVHAQFRWSEYPDHLDSVQVGAFVHERVGGRLVNSGVARRAGWGRAALASALPVVFGPLQVVVEAAVPERNLAVQRRAILRIEEPAGLAVSDILLATDARADGVPRIREDVAISARADSLPTLGEPLALYWEIYGLVADTADHVSYTVTLTASDVAGGRSWGTEIVRGVENLLSRGDDDQTEIHWDVVRPAGVLYQPEFIVIRLDERPGSVRLRIRIRDRQTGAEVRAERVVTRVR